MMTVDQERDRARGRTRRGVREIGLVAASATGFGPPDERFADNSNHTFSFSNLEWTTSTQADWARVNRLEPPT